MRLRCRYRIIAHHGKAEKQDNGGISEALVGLISLRKRNVRRSVRHYKLKRLSLSEVKHATGDN